MAAGLLYQVLKVKVVHLLFTCQAYLNGNAAQTNIAVQEAVYTDATPAMGVSKSIFDEKHILIVDDDYRNIYALRQALEHKGVHIVEASTAWNV